MKLSTGQLAAYALPALAIAALGQPFYMFVPTLYARELALGVGAVGAVLLLVRVVDAVADLVAGRLSDRLRSRFGRRRPFVLLASPVAAVSAWMVLAPPEGAGLLWLGVWSLVASMAWAAIILPLNAWGAELATGYRERIAITAWREGATALGVIAALVLVTASMGPQAQLREGLRLLGLIVAVAAPLACAIAVLALPDPPPARPDPGSLWQGLAGAARNRPFRLLVSAYLINGVANALPATLFISFVSDRLQRPDLAGPLLGLYFVAGLLALPVWSWAGGRFGKHVVWCGAMVWACLVFAAALLVDGPQDTALFVAVCAASGLALGADLVLPAAMQADVVDLDTLETGAAPRTGVSFALWSMATKLGLALAAGAAFIGLGLAGYVAGAGPDQTPEALTALGLAYCAVPIALKLVAIALTARFPLDAAAQAAIRARIEATG